MSDAHRTIRLPKTSSAPSTDELASALARLRDDEEATIELSWAFAGSTKWFKLSVEHVEGNGGPLWTLKQSDGLEIKRIWAEQTNNLETVRTNASKFSGAPTMGGSAANTQEARVGAQSGGHAIAQSGGHVAAQSGGHVAAQSGGHVAAQSGGHASAKADGSHYGAYPRFQPGIQCGAQPVFKTPETARVSGGHPIAANPKELFEAEEEALEQVEPLPDEQSELEFLGEDGTGASQLVMQLADPRTGLASFGAMLKYVDVEVNRFQEYGDPLTLMVFAVCSADEKPLPINAVTSLVLRVQALKRRLDVAGHLEGDLYALLLPNTKAGKAVLLANRLREALTATPLAPGFNKSSLKLSFGIATIPDRGMGADLVTLIAQAKTAMV